MLEALLREERRRRLTPGRLDTAPRVLKTRDDGSEPDDENEGRHKHLDQSEPSRLGPGAIPLTLMRPVAATTTARVAPFTGLVTVYVPAGLAAPRSLNVTLAVVLTRNVPGSDILIAPTASVPGPVHTGPPHPPRLRRMFVPPASTHTVVFCVIAICRPRLIAVASSRATAWSADVLA